MADIPPDYQEKLKAWKDKLKNKWDYNRKLMVFKGSDGQIVYYTTTTSTTTTVATPQQNVTQATNTTLSSPIVVTLTTAAGEGKTGEVAGADTSQLITIVGITCASLLALLIILLIFIRICRRSPAKRKQRISLRRPLNPPEPEEHIYAEIEPLQRSNSPGGASGNSGDIQLPKKKERKRGISSFRFLSTRIYRFFSHEQADNQSVFYNRNEQRSVVPPPEPPQRNVSPKRKRGQGVKRFESTASRRALLDGDSQVSTTSVEMRPSSSSEGRDNIYNPLLRESSSRQSGPYDHLTNVKANSGEGEAGGEGEPPESPHDYFTLEKNDMNTSPRLPGRSPHTHLSPVSEANSEDNNPLDSMIIENEQEPRVSSTHDYFVLEPHEKEAQSAKGSPSKGSVRSDKSPTKSLKNGSVHKSPRQSPEKSMKEKPVAKPRVTKGVSPTTSNPGSPSSSDGKTIQGNNGYDQMDDANYVDPGNKMNDSMEDANYIDPESKVDDLMDGDANYVDPETKIDQVVDDANYFDPTAKTKDDIYVLSKLGTAPKPPEIDVDSDYLAPMDIKKRDYVDVFPNPPPRTSSLQTEEHGSPKKHQSHESTV